MEKEMADRKVPPVAQGDVYGDGNGDPEMGPGAVDIQRIEKVYRSIKFSHSPIHWLIRLSRKLDLRIIPGKL